MESFDLSLRTKSLWLVAAVAAAVLGIALLLVARLVSVGGRPAARPPDRLEPAVHRASRPASSPPARPAGWSGGSRCPCGGSPRRCPRMARAGRAPERLPDAPAAAARCSSSRRRSAGWSASLEESQRARERSYVEAVGAVVTAADARDHETTGHSFRVALYAVALAKAMGLHGEPLKAIEWGALLHDVGQDGGAGRDPAQDGAAHRRGVAHHAAAPRPGGSTCWPRCSFLQPAALDIIYSHHERWDGHGLSARPRRRGGPAGRPHLRGGGHLRRHHLRPPLPAGAPPPGRRGRAAAGGRPAARSGASSRPSASSPRSSCAACASSASASTRA